MFYDDIFNALNSIIPNFRGFLLKGKNYKTKLGPLTLEAHNFQENIVILYVCLLSSIYVFTIHINPKNREAELLLPENMMLRDKISKNISFAKILKEFAKSLNHKKPNE